MEINAQSLVGTFNMYNILSAISLLFRLNIPLDTISKAINNFSGVPGRLQKHFLPNGATAFIDYAHNPSSFEAVLSTLRGLSKHMIVIFGAGGDRDKTKRPLMGSIASSIADQVILTSDNPRSEEPEDIIEQIKSGISSENIKKINILIDRELAIKKAYSLSNSNSMIIILGKGPDEYQIVKGIKTYFSETQILRSL